MSHMQTLEYKEGKEAYAEGKSILLDNPYRYRSSTDEGDSEKFDAWLDGFMDAREEDDQEIA